MNNRKKNELKNWWLYLIFIGFLIILLSFAFKYYFEYNYFPNSVDEAIELYEIYIKIPFFIILGIVFLFLGGVTKYFDYEKDKKIKVRNVKKENDSIEILKIRYAKGEISKKEYGEMKKELEG